MNAYSELFIYTTQILKGKNFKVDDIHEYLETCESINQVDAQANHLKPIKAQFIKPLLKTKIVINFAQTKLTSTEQLHIQQQLSAQMTFDWNYVELHNYDSENQGHPLTKLFYFIIGKRWASESSIELELEMDVINSLIDNQYYENLRPAKWLSLSPKTTIFRQHKDRFQGVSTSPLIAYKKIDFYSEGILPTLFKTKESTMRDTGWNEETLETDDFSWYLIYRSQSTNSDSPIDVLLCSDEQKVVQGSTSGYSGKRDPVADLSGVNAWYIYGGDRDGQNYNAGASISFTARDGTHTLTLTATQCIIIEKRFIYLYEIGVNGATEVALYRAPAFKRFREVDFNGVYVVRKSTYHANNPLTSLTPTIISGFSIDASFPTSQQEQVIGAISEIDRTDPKLLKIIKLPYCPINLIQTGGNLGSIILPANWGVRQGEANPYFPTLIYYTHPNLTEAFVRRLTLKGSDSTLPNPYSSVFYAPLRTKFGEVDLRNDEYESKLLHSDYFQRKFVYDSFAYIFRNEFMNINNTTGTWSVDFCTTATMNSKMVFKFLDEEFVVEDSIITLKTDIQDYSGILYIARNNELPIFNSAFLNYIRTGYNYDVKTKNRQLASNIVGGVLSTAGAIVSAVSSATTGPIGIAGAIGLGITATTKFYNAISQTAQAEQNIQRQLKTCEMQGLSVIGGDDVDLMSEFTNGNKAKLIQYEVSEKMKKCLADLFYYCGYIANFQGIPNVKTRQWFNFVQADAIFDYEQNFTQELIEELKKKYNEGITFLHCVKIFDMDDDDYLSLWDFEQKYENWENSMMLRYIAVNNTAETDYTVERIMQRNISGSIILVPTPFITSSSRAITIRMRDPNLKLLKEIKCNRFGIDGGLNPYMYYEVYQGDTLIEREQISLSDYASVSYFWTFQATSLTTQQGLTKLYNNSPKRVEIAED